MKGTGFLCGIVALVVTVPAMAVSTATFEEVVLAPESFHNGQTSTGFNSGGVYFYNEFIDAGTYTYWQGTAASNVTDTTTPGFTNQYAAWTGSGDQSANYGIVTGGNRIELPVPTTVQGLQITNTTYAALSMRDGDFFVDPFGDPDNGGLVEDWFSVIITGKDASGAEIGSVEFYLADYRFADSGQDYILDTWEWVDLTALGNNVSTLEFSWDGSQKGQYGINIPAYAAIDNLTVAEVPEPAALSVLMVALTLVIRRR